MKENSMNKFKVGDKVICEPNHECLYGEVLYLDKNAQGTEPYLVGLSKLSSGDNYDFIDEDVKVEINRKGYENHCFWAYEEQIKPVYPCGTKVIVDGKEGKVIYFDKEDCEYLVGRHGFVGHSGGCFLYANQQEYNYMMKNGYDGECSWKDPDSVKEIIEEPEKEMVDHPSHYNSNGKYETIDKMRLMFGDDEVKTWIKLTIFKYMDRMGHKDNPEQEQGKIDWYLDYLKNME